MTTTSSPPPLTSPTPSRPRRGTALGAVIVLILSVLPALAIASPSQAADPQTVISLTFDDGNVDQVPAAASLVSHGMRGTFFVNSGTVGQTGYLTLGQLNDLKAAGHEIGGHSVNHASLPALPSAEAKRQICLDRNNLLDWGFSVRSFAYPFAETTTAVDALAQECGYNSARNLGDLQSRFGGTAGLYSETIPPANAFETRALDQVESTWTLADLKSAVTNAETHGGGWVQYTFHNVCTTSCGDLSVTQATLNEFLDWLQPRAASNNTVVKTVGDVVGGAVKPAVSVPAPTPTTDPSGLSNPGFETLAPSGVAECWLKGGYGSNTSLFDLVTPGRTGDRAGRLTVTEYADGEANLLPALDLGTCAPTAGAGKAYTISGWYTSTANTQFDIYIRTASGQWQYWDSSPYFAPSTTWTQATFTTGVVPEGYTGISFGLNLFSNGVLTVDDYAITAGTATTPTTTATVSPATANGSNGWYVTTPTVTLTKTAGAGWINQYSFDNGATWTTYTAPFSVPEGTTTVSYRAKGAGSYVEATKTVTLKVDTAKPTVTTSFDAANRTLTVVPTDPTPGSGVAKVEYSTNSGTTWVPYTAPVAVPAAATTTTYQVRSTDVAGNVSTVVSQAVPPELKTSHTVDPDKPTGAAGWYSTAPKIAVIKDASTPGAEYSVNGGPWITYAIPVVIKDGDAFRYRGVSGTERGVVHEVALKVDTVRPTVAASFDTTRRKLTITGADAGSGVAKLETSTNGGATWTAYGSSTTTIQLSDSGASYRFRATDTAGNVSDVGTSEIKDRQLIAAAGLSLSPTVRTYGKAASARIVLTGPAGNPTPTGTVAIRVDGKQVATATLSGGAASVQLPADLRAGSHTVTATYSGDAETKPTTSNAARLTVRKATPAVSRKLASSRIKAGSRPKVTAAVSVPGTAVRATGKISVTVDGKVVAKVSLRASDRGRVTIRLPKISRKGSHAVRVVYAGSADISGRTSKAVTLRVR